MYIDKTGKKHKFIHLYKVPINGTFPGWYFEYDGEYKNHGPFDSLKEAEKALKIYIVLRVNDGQYSTWLRFRTWWLGLDIRPRDKWHTTNIPGRAIVLFFRRTTFSFCTIMGLLGIWAVASLIGKI